MEEQHTSIQGPDTLPDALNFRVLKSLGLDTIIKTGAQCWTDYNESDPGITILEILTLAITDLGYRSTFPIEDILTIGPSDTTAPNYFPDQFHTASHILTNSPVTTDDLRKSMIDITGVANAWVLPLPQQVTPIRGLFDVIINPSENVQQITAPFHDFVTQLTPRETTTLSHHLKKFRAVEPGTIIHIPSEFVELLITLFHLSPSLQHELESALNAFFAVLPECFPDIVTHLEILENPENKLGNSRYQRRNSLYQFIQTIFFSKRLPDDRWIPIGLRKALEAIKVAVSTHQALIQEVRATCNDTRPLSQDLHQIILREPLEILFDFDLILSPEANPEATFARILLQLKQLLSGPIPFLSLDEMIQQQNGDINSVFNGPALSHGFIEHQSLQPLSSALLSSELTECIRNLPGILHVNHLHFALTAKGKKPGTSEWTSQAIIPTHAVPVLGPITNNTYSIPIDEEELLHQFESLLHTQNSPKLTPKTRDLPIPSGNYRDPSFYTSIQEEFPRIYELQPHGPSSPEPTRTRIGEIRQLQAYLLIFDQILTDYLAQLANIGQLYSWSPTVTKTRFFQGLETTVHQLNDLVETEDYKTLTPTFNENHQTFITRRNAFLETMLCRMGRDLTQDLQSLYPNPAQLETQLEHRQNILAHYDTLSAQRGTAQNYQYNQSAIKPSGLAQWINALTGFHPLDDQERLFLDQFAQANLEDLASSTPWMPLYSLTTQDQNPLNVPEIMTVGGIPSNYRLDRKNRPISEDEKKLWYTWKLLPLALTKKQSPVDLPVTGREQIVVSQFEGTFFFRVFNQSSQCILNLTSLQLQNISPQLQELEHQLQPYWQGATIPPKIEQAIITLIINLIQYTHRLILSGPLPNGGYSKPCQLNQTFADEHSAQPVISAMTKLLERYNRLSQQITVIEHSLLRPAPSEPFYHISFLDNDGSTWASSEADTTLVNLQQISNDGMESINWSITSSTKTTNFQTSCLPPFTTIELPSPPPQRHITFSISNENSTTVNITYGMDQHTVRLKSTNSYASENDAESAIKQWIYSIASEQTNAQKPWLIQMTPYTLANQTETSSIPHVIQSDPYSFITSIILPNWPTRFQNSNFRNTLETIIRKESPSHLFINILWVDHSWYQEFQQLHSTWVELYQEPQTDPKFLASISRPILDMILHRSYPHTNG